VKDVASVFSAKPLPEGRRIGFVDGPNGEEESSHEVRHRALWDLQLEPRRHARLDLLGLAIFETPGPPNFRDDVIGIDASGRKEGVELFAGIHPVAARTPLEAMLEFRLAQQDPFGKARG